MSALTGYQRAEEKKRKRNQNGPLKGLKPFKWAETVFFEMAADNRNPYKSQYQSQLAQAQEMNKQVLEELAKSKKNDPRVCDIDIIDFNGLIKANKLLKLPHPRSHIRNFVLYPIKEIDPIWIHPIFKKNVDFLINQLSQNSRIEITRLRKSVII